MKADGRAVVQRLGHPAHPVRSDGLSFADWPQLGRSNAHDAVTGDPGIGVSNAPGLGVVWMSSLAAGAIGSPVVTYETALGKNVAYAGSERGDVVAVDTSTGTQLWSTSLGVGDAVRSTPVFDEGAVWVATTYNPAIFKLDARTGAILCSIAVSTAIEGGIMEATLPDGARTVYFAESGTATQSGPLHAIDEGTCTQVFSVVANPAKHAGSVSGESFAVDASDRPVVLWGTRHPDDALYSSDAKTGRVLWRFAFDDPSGYDDVLVPATISVPMKNRFADGVAYVANGHSGQMYAIDLTTGALVWRFNFSRAVGDPPSGGRSGAALYQSDVIFGYEHGVFAVDATTAVPIWNYRDPSGAEVASAPAVVGSAGNEVVGFGDDAGMFQVVSLANGSPLYAYQTHGYLTGAPAESAGRFIATGSDGFLYAFGGGGGNGAGPATVTLSPPLRSLQSNAGSITVQGTASGSAGIAGVQVAVQANGPTGQWWDAAANAWIGGAIANAASVASPGSTQSAWTFAFPVPAAGGNYRVFAHAVDVSGVADVTGSVDQFAVQPAAKVPVLTLSSAYVAPGGTFLVRGTGFGAGENVAFSIFGAVLATQTATKTGYVPNTTIAVPVSDPFGPATLVATGVVTRKVTAAPLLIEIPWSQAGTDATHQAFEPYDQTFLNLPEPPPGGQLMLRAWYAGNGPPVNASPVVSGGLAFFGNDAGTFAAVDASTGAPAWSYALSDGAAIHSAAAVDAQNNRIVFDADDGTMTGLVAANGQPSGSLAIGGILTAPAISAGIAYAGSDAGTVTAVADGPGTVVWSATLGGPVHATPAVDAATGTAIAVDDTGTVTALDAATGIARWSVMPATQGFASAPAIANGRVFVASLDGNLYALDEATGATAWTAAIGSAVHANLAIAGGVKLIVGSDAGTLTFLQLDGTPIAVEPFSTSAVEGIGTVAGAAFAATADGTVTAFDTRQSPAGIVFTYKTNGALATAPVVANGAMYLGAADGGLYAFTPSGLAPYDQRKRLGVHRPSRTGAPAWRGGTVRPPERGFRLIGPRAAPFAFALPGRAAAVSTRSTQRSYAIAWQPHGAFASAGFAAQLGRALGAAFVDTSPYPKVLSDAAIQNLIVRTIAAHRLRVDARTRFVVATAAGASPPLRAFCGYASALTAHGALHTLVRYAYVPYPGSIAGCASPRSPAGDAAGVLAILGRIDAAAAMTRDPRLRAP